MKFKDLPYVRPDSEKLLQSLNGLIEKFEKAQTAAEQIEVVELLEKEVKTVQTMGAIANIRNTVNTRDAFYDGERAFFDELSPLLEGKLHSFCQAAVKSRFRGELAEKFGAIWLDNMELRLKAFSPPLIPLMQEENQLASQYEKLCASAQIPFEGKTLTLSQLTLYKQSPDRKLRRGAYEAEGGFFDEHRDEFDGLYDKLVKNRSRQARLLGFENYVELGYLRNLRNCYGPEQVENFRRQVKEDVVPIADEIKKVQAKRIGVEDFKFYDDIFRFPDGNPDPKGSPEEIMEAGRKMYAGLSPETAEFVKMMYNAELFDVLSRDGKAPGGYSTFLSDYGWPFVFSNFNGTAGDVDVFTHEFGHAFAFSEAAKRVPLDELLCPTSDGAEVASMSMEFLTAPYHELFFREETAKYELSHAEDALAFLPYGCEVDHFQHLVYENPGWTPERRNAAWAELERLYRPYLNSEGLPFYGRGAGWQRQMHIYLSPFYYIDYCLAQTIALQIWAASLKDWNGAWQTYLRFIRQGGTATFVGLVESSGLLSPLEDGSLKAVCRTAQEWLRGKWAACGDNE